ncbi:hypothetical protein KAH81_07935 [bacterium]|nr:hypothetical protein [bacterium]
MRPILGVFILTLGLLFTASPCARAESLDDFVTRIIASDTLGTPEQYMFTAEETVISYQDKKRTEKKGAVFSQKRYTIYGEDSVEVEVLSTTVEGDSLPDNGKGNSEERETLADEDMPFNTNTLPDYIYEDLGVVTLNSESTRKIRFRSKKRSKNKIDGIAWFDPTTAYLERMDFEYARKPFAIKDFSAVLKLTYRDGYKFLSYFEMELRVKVPIIMEMNLSVKQVITKIDVL